MTNAFEDTAKLDVTIIECGDEPGAWTVEAIEYAFDGAIEKASFYGPDAKTRSENYARWKYGRTE